MMSDIIPRSCIVAAAKGKKWESERREILTSETQMTPTIDRLLKSTNRIHSKQTKIEWSRRKARGS